MSSPPDQHPPIEVERHRTPLYPIRALLRYRLETPTGSITQHLPAEAVARFLDESHTLEVDVQIDERGAMVVRGLNGTPL